jgi:hypothetical protein
MRGAGTTGGDAFIAGATLGQLADQVGARHLRLEQFLARSLQLKCDAVVGNFVAELAEKVAEDAARPVGLAAFAGFTTAFEASRLLLELAEDRQIMKISIREGHR